MRDLFPGALLVQGHTAAYVYATGLFHARAGMQSPPLTARQPMLVLLGWNSFPWIAAAYYHFVVDCLCTFADRRVVNAVCLGAPVWYV